MFAVTRNIRGARRTGRGLGCAHPKCRCGYYRLRRSALRLPLFFWRQTLSCSGLARLGRKRRVARTRSLMPVIASGAKQSRGGVHRLLDCFVAELVIGPATSGRTRWLLAMTAFLSSPARRGTPQNSLANFVGTPSRGRGTVSRSEIVEGVQRRRLVFVAGVSSRPRNPLHHPSLAIARYGRSPSPAPLRSAGEDEEARRPRRFAFVAA